jgi:hypothetical protein
MTIKVIKNLISLDEATVLIEYIDKNAHHFSSDMKGLWFKKFFGIDDIYKHGKGEPVITGLGDVEGLSVRIVEDVKDAMSSHFMDTEPIFLNSFWFAKHLPGDKVVAHVDTEDGYNEQFVYSAILYLNTVEDGGVLTFPRLDLSFKPEACDLIIFPSDGEDMLHEVVGIGEDRYTLPMWFTKDKELELKFSM